MYCISLRGILGGAALWISVQLLLPLLLVSCNCALLQPGVAVEVRIPLSEWSEAGAPVGHRLVYPDSSGDVKEVYLPAGNYSAVLEVQRGYNVPIAAYPLGRLTPSGACIANHAEHKYAAGKIVVPLRFRYGPAAQVLLELWDLSERCETVHFEALTREMEKEGQGDPWNCDLARVKSAIARGRLNRLQVCDLDEFEFCVDLPAGDWIAGNSLWKGKVCSSANSGEDEGDEADEGGGGAPGLQSVQFSGLYPGRHCFYSAESGLELHLYVGKTGDCRWVCDSLAGFSD